VAVIFKRLWATKLRFRRKSKVVYTVCLSCQKRMAPATAHDAVNAAADLVAYRQQAAGGDPVREQLLAHVELGALRGMAGIQRGVSRHGS